MQHSAAKAAPPGKETSMKKQSEMLMIRVKIAMRKFYHGKAWPVKKISAKKNASSGISASLSLASGLVWIIRDVWPRWSGRRGGFCRFSNRIWARGLGSAAGFEGLGKGGFFPGGMKMVFWRATGFEGLARGGQPLSSAESAAVAKPRFRLLHACEIQALACLEAPNRSQGRGYFLVLGLDNSDQKKASSQPKTVQPKTRSTRIIAMALG